MYNFAMKQLLSVTVVTLILLSPGSLVTSHKAGIEIKSNNTLTEAHLYYLDFLLFVNQTRLSMQSFIECQKIIE